MSKWGLYIGNELMVSYSDYNEALNAARYVFDEHRIPHEIKKVEQEENN